jgi:hypothetical protein
VVIKGGSRGGAAGLAGHLLRADTNESVEVTELHGVTATTLPAALREMAAVAIGTRCSRPLYHASLNTAPGEILTAAQKARAITALEQRLGLTGHPRAVVEHCKAGRAHLHVVWGRIDPATLKAVHDGFNYRAHEEVARQLEREFGHARVQGAHVERNGQPRPARTLPTADIQQAARTGRDPDTITAEITRLWQAADSGPAFMAALQAAGYVLAQGDRRGFCLVDSTGGVHSLARRIVGVRSKEVAARLAGIELASLPTVDQARHQVRQRQAMPVTTAKDLASLGAPPQLVKGGAGSSAVKTPPPCASGGGRTAKATPAGGLAAALKRPATHAPEKPAAGRGRIGSETLYSTGIRLARPEAPQSSRPAGATLARLGSFLGGSRPAGRFSVRVAVPRLLTLFLEARPLFIPGGRAAPRVTPVKGSPPERLNLRRPDGPSTESIGQIQEQIDKLTAYGLSTGESMASQVQELKNVLHALLEQAAVRAILGPYYRPEHRKQELGR